MDGSVVGWDIGGAHLKAVRLDATGAIVFARQEACPLWRGLGELEAALARILSHLPKPAADRHGITMTGELADNFPNRTAGVLALAARMREHLAPMPVEVFAGHAGWIAAAALAPDHARRVASANWLASGFWTASRMPEGLLIDIGTTTTDLLPFASGQPRPRGFTDSERMRHDELLYGGVARTPAMTIALRAPVNGAWAPVMAELFATTADVYRLTGELPERADQHPAADQGPKTSAASRQRLARQFGYDAEDLPPAHWQDLARYLRECQLARLREAVELQLSRGLLTEQAPLVGLGVGRFLVRQLAQRLDRPYREFGDLFTTGPAAGDFDAADCGPAAAIAALALHDWRAEVR